MKTKEELNAMKEEVEALNKKQAEMNDDDLAQVAGGIVLSADSAATSTVPLKASASTNPPTERITSHPWDKA